MIALLFFAGVLILGWGLGSLLAWYDYGTRCYAPYNWRLFLGPVVYINWAEEDKERLSKWTSSSDT